MNVLFVTGSVEEEASGPYASLMATAEALAACGHVVTIVGSKAGGAREYRTASGVRVIGMRRIGPLPLHCTPSLILWLSTYGTGYDLVSLQAVWQLNVAYTIRWCRNQKKPYVMSIHGNLHEEALQRRRFQKRIARMLFFNRAFSRASCIHVLNAAEYNAVRRARICAPICIAPNGVWLDGTEPAPAASRETGSASRVSPRRCLYLGRLHPIKGVDLLLRAWGKLSCKRQEWRLVIAGPTADDYECQLRHLVTSLHIDGSVDFLGPVYGDDRSRLLNESDFIVLPSRSEGSPMVAMETLGAGRPLVLTKQCRFPEVADAGAGIEVAAGVDDLAAALSRMIAMSDEERAVMGRRGWALARECYQWPAIARQLAAVYLWLLGQGSQPQSVVCE